MRGAAYIRVSTVEQLEFSPEAQRKAIIQYAKQHEIVLDQQHFYIDDGYSGKRAEKRPAFMEMIQAAKGHPKPFDVIIVHRFDRFARNREDSVIYKALLRREHSIRVVSVTEHLEDDKFSVILESMLEGMAEYYSLNLADEVRKGMREKALRGGFQSRPPLGYAIEGKGHLKPKEEEVRIIKRIYQLFLRADCSMLEIAKTLNKEGFRTKAGNPFERRSINHILRNKIYCGYLRWNRTQRDHGKVHKNDEEDWIEEKGDFIPIVDVKQWEQAQAKLNKRSMLGAKKSWKDSRNGCRHFLRGLLRCKECGGTLVYGQSKGYTYYRCNNKAKGKCSSSQYISVKDIEKVIFQVMAELAGNSQYLLKEELWESQEAGRRLEVEKERLIKKIGRAKEAYLQGIDTLEDYKKSKRLCESQLQEINNQSKHLCDQPRKPEWRNCGALLRDKKVNVNRKNQALKSIISEIVVDVKKEEYDVRYY